MNMANKTSKKNGTKYKPMTPKEGVTRNNNSRRYDCGGKLKK